MKSNFKPTDIANCTIWCRPESLEGTADGATVSSWPNEGSAGSAMSSGSPVYVANAILGKGAVNFNGKALYGPAAWTSISAYSMFVVLKCLSTSIASGWLFGNDGSDYASGAGLAFYQSGTTYRAHYMPMVAWNSFGAITTNWETWSISRGDNGSTGTSYINELELAGVSGSTPLTPLATPHTVLSGNAYIAEIIAYNRALSEGEMLQVQQYLYGRYHRPVLGVPSVKPSDITGLQGWWRGNELVGNDGESVTSWLDYSGLGNTLSGAAGATIKENVVPNGKKCISVNDNTFSVDLASGYSSKAHTLIQVHYPLTTFVKSGCDGARTVMFGDRAALGYKSGYDTPHLVLDAVAWVNATTKAPYKVPHYWWIRGEGNSGSGANWYSSERIAKTVTSNTMNSPINHAVRIGAGLTGYIAETLFYDKALSDAELLSIKEYLYWSLWEDSNFIPKIIIL